ncbi:hypothetical protein HYW82_00565 [Candidatus Peregrinibacteria bacterium]|nr:hypothetical protein [Candidatus Peregrinibacteria bacterium]
MELQFVWNYNFVILNSSCHPALPSPFPYLAPCHPADFCRAKIPSPFPYLAPCHPELVSGSFVIDAETSSA